MSLAQLVSGLWLIFLSETRFASAVKHATAAASERYGSKSGT